MVGLSSPAQTRLLLLLTFVESVGTVLLQRGLYFYTSSLHGFSESQNLWLAFVQGVTYVLGATLSHPLTQRFGERRTATAAIGCLMALHVLLAAAPGAALIVAAFPVIGFLQAIKWPIIESYVSAGRSPQVLVGLLGRYNVSWALAIPIALGLCGAILAAHAHHYFFMVPALLNACALLMVTRWPARPAHLELDHPQRPDEATLRRYGALVVSARWTMVASYTLLFLLAPLMPSIFGRLGLEVRQATMCASLLDVLRLTAFALLGVFPQWHGRSWPLAVISAVLPASFFMVLFGQTLPVVLLGETLFGLAAGVAYCAALYYALIVKNASVDAGGAHESLIGLGFAVGPLAGLAGHALAAPAGGYVTSMLLAVAPLVLTALGGAFRPLRALGRSAL